MSSVVENCDDRYTIVEHDACQAHRAGELQQLLAHCEVVDGRPPLGDHALNALANAEPMIHAFTLVDPPSRLVAYAQVTPTAETPPTWTIDIAIDPSHRHERAAILDTTLGAAVDRLRARGAHSLQWWCHEPTETDHSIAESHGLTPSRQLLEMYTQLGPIPLRPTITSRPFVAEVDEPALLEVNNLAFAQHPDQGNWTHDSLAGRFNSDWFDPAGLLVHVDVTGAMLGFCWTKIHHPTATLPVGEIYVVAVRPSHHGHGLGRALTQTGLASLHERHINHVMLFVDGANTTARNLYQQLGFSVTSTTTAFRRDNVMNACG